MDCSDYRIRISKPSAEGIALSLYRDRGIYGGHIVVLRFDYAILSPAACDRLAVRLIVEGYAVYRRLGYDEIRIVRACIEPDVIYLFGPVCNGIERARVALCFERLH